MVIGSLDRGGSERQVLELVRSATPDHAACSVVCLSHEGSWAKEARAAGVPVTAVGFDRPWKLWRLVGLARALRRARPDVVYAMLFWGYSLALPTAAVVVRSAVRVAGRRSLPADDRPRHAFWLPARRLADRCSHAVVANSRYGAEAWRRETPSLNGRLHVVANGVRFPDAPADPPAEPLEMVCVANLIHYKGIDVLLRAVARLPANLPRWRLTLIGDGPERDALMTLANSLGVSERVWFAGRRHDDVDSFLRRSHLAVLPSRGEGMPNAVLEAMAHGVPVVASAVGGIPELLGTGAGRTVPVEDHEALAAALARMLTDPELRRAAGLEGRRLAERVYAVSTMRDATLNLFDTLVHERGGG